MSKNNPSIIHVRAFARDPFGSRQRSGYRYGQYSFFFYKGENTVWVYDDVARAYTTCHSMGRRAQARVRRLGADERMCIRYLGARECSDTEVCK